MKIAKVIQPIRKGDSFQKLTNRILTGIIAALALFASVSGVFNTSIYGELLLNGTMSDSLVFGSVVQDIITIPSSLLLLILSVHQIRRKNLKVQILMSGLIAYLFYGYGLYTIQGQYTSLYFIYLAVFGMTFYTLIFNVIYLAARMGVNYSA